MWADKIEGVLIFSAIQIKFAATYRFSEDTHELWELVCEHGQHGGERAQSGREEDEEG